MTPRKPDPVKHCDQCGKLMQRKRYGGRLQDMATFLAARYCDQECMAAAFEGIPRTLTPLARTLRDRARKLKGLGPCESCGAAGEVDVHHVDGNLDNAALENLARLCRTCHLNLHRGEGGQWGQAPRAFAKEHNAASATDDESWREAEVARTISVANAHRGEVLATTEPLGVRADGVAHALTGEGHDASEDGTGRSVPIVQTQQVAPSLTKNTGKGTGFSGMDEAVLAVAEAKRRQGFDAYNGAVTGDTSATLMKTVSHLLVDEPTVAPTLRGSVGSGGGGQKDDALAVGVPPEPLVEGAACSWDPKPDGRRYAACGDGVVANQATFIGLRLRAVMAGLDPDDLRVLWSLMPEGAPWDS